jgi:hypothetical protein
MTSLRQAVVNLLAAFAGALLVPALAADAASSKPNFTGLWKLADLDTVLRSGEHDADNLTPKAREARAFFKKHSRGFEDEAVGHCVPHGLPWAMTSPARDYLHDIYQTEDRITLLFEGMDVYRVIHFNKQSVPENFGGGTWGYSMAHWEGETLVIVTQGLSAKNPFGSNQRSDQATVTERWRLVQDPKYGQALDIDIVVEDPEVFVKPSRGHELLVPAASDAVLLPYGCTESLWEDYVEKRRAEIAQTEEGRAKQ